MKNLLTQILTIIILFSIGFSQDFDISINVAGGTSNYELTAGFDPQATDGYDSGFDQFAPPAPPPPAFDAALGWEGDRYYTQILEGDGDLSEHEYEIQLSYPEDNLITVAWDNTGWSDLMTSCMLQDAFGGVMFNVDMLTDNSMELTNPALNILKLKITPSEAVPTDIYGCTNASALNYGYNCEGEFVGDPTMDDGCCEYPESYEGIIIINEINYNPAASYDQSDEDYEFIELYNTSDESVLLDGFHLTSQNIDFIIGDDVWISHGGYLVIARNSETYSGSIQWTGGRLENDTDSIDLKDSYDMDVDFVQYDDGPPWPTEPDAGGSTLELISPNLDNGLAESWQASYVLPGGTPGEPNSANSEDVYGCTDESACNFNPDATVDDGSCWHPEDEGWCDCDGHIEDCSGDCGGEAFENECGCVGGSTGLEDEFCYGCTDPDAVNYDPEATIDDESCEYLPPSDDPDFQVCMNASTTGTQNYDLCFGVSPDATDGFDLDIDQYAPPAPPPPSFDATLAWDSDRYYTQILATTIEERVYDVQLQYPENDLIILEWDNTGWSDMMTSCLLQDAFGGVMFNVDMLSDNSLELDNPAFNTLKLKITPSGDTEPPDENPWEGLVTHTPASGVFLGQATIGGELASEGDWVAAFDEVGNIAGALALTLYDGDAYLNLVIYGDDITTPDVDEGINPGEDFTLKIWDSSEDIIWNYPESFGGWYNNNGAPMEGYNDPSVVYDFPTVVIDEIYLMSNWNLMSFDIEIEENTTEDVFADIIGDDNLVYVTGFGETGAQFFDPYGLPFLNTLTEINPGFGFWVKINDGTTLVQEGIEMGQNYSFNIMASWNLMSYWPQVSITPQDAFAELIEDGNLLYVTGLDETGAHYFNPNGLPFLNTLTSLDNGYGYWVKVNNAVDGFQYPAAMAGMVKAVVPDVNPDIHRTNKFMFVNGTVSFDHIDYVIGDKVSVLTEGGLLVGELEILLEEGDLYLKTGAVYGDDITTDIIDGAIDGERLTFAYREYVSDPVDIRFAGDMEPRNLSLKIKHIPEKFALVQNYPNPFNPITNLRYDLPEQAQVTLTIYDLTGREVTQLVNTTQEPGFKSVRWDATDRHGKPASAGVYLYQIRAGEFVQTRKMVLLK